MYSLWIAFRFCIFVLWTQLNAGPSAGRASCELLSDFVYSFFEHNLLPDTAKHHPLWIAFRFCIFVLWTQSGNPGSGKTTGCELLSDFVYSFFEHNWPRRRMSRRTVVNCFQILYIRSLNTIHHGRSDQHRQLWIAFRFCIFVLWTQSLKKQGYDLDSCELLSDFVYSFFEHNVKKASFLSSGVVNCFQILYIRSLNTMYNMKSSKIKKLWIAFRFCIFVLWTQWTRRSASMSRCCELLSDFVYSFFEHNCQRLECRGGLVVNCFQILYIRSLNTMTGGTSSPRCSLWIAFRFCIFVLWTQ